MYDIDDVQVTRWNKVIKSHNIHDLIRQTVDEDNKGMTRAEIGKLLHISQERVRQIEITALNKMWHYLTNNGVV